MATAKTTVIGIDGNFQRNKKSDTKNWCCKTATGFIVVEGSVEDPFDYVNTHKGVSVGENILYGFENNGVQGTFTKIEFETESEGIDISSIARSL